MKHFIVYAAAVWPVVSGIILMFLRTKTPEQWVALGERSPRLQGFIRMFRAIGFDPVHAVQGCIQMFTGQLFPGASVLTAVINPALSDDVRITVRPIPPSKN